MTDQHGAAGTIQSLAYRVTQQSQKDRTMKTNHSAVNRITQFFTSLALAAGVILPQAVMAASPARWRSR